MHDFDKRFNDIMRARERSERRAEMRSPRAVLCLLTAFALGVAVTFLAMGV